MDTMVTTILSIVLALTVTLALLYLVKMLREELRDLRSSLDQTKTSVSTSLLENTRDIATRLERASYAIADLKKETGGLTEIGRSMQDLQAYLRSPKLRGNIGEAVLSDLLGQIFPKKNYQLQYTYKSGERVDAIIRTLSGILPIDSKFPLENFQRLYTDTNHVDLALIRRNFLRDVRNHIKTISTKYINPAESTLDFALMYVPSESVYYEIVQSEDLMQYSRSVRVYPVSPNTLYAALQTILLSFEGERLQERAKDVFALLRAIHKDYTKTFESFATLGSHLTKAHNKYQEVEGSMTQLGQKISQSQLSSREQPPTIES